MKKKDRDLYRKVKNYILRRNREGKKTERITIHNHFKGKNKSVLTKYFYKVKDYINSEVFKKRSKAAKNRKKKFRPPTSVSYKKKDEEKRQNELEIPDNSISEKLLRKKNNLEKLNYSPSARESIDGRITYLVVTSQPIGKFLKEIALTKPIEFMYRVSAIYETLLVLTKNYRSIAVSNKWDIVYRNLGTYSYSEMNDLIEYRANRIVEMTNKIYKTNVIRLLQFSTMIVERNKKNG